MKNYSKIYPLIALAIILFLSSCSSNLFTGRRFNLDLVKVDKEKQKEVSRKDIKEVEIVSSEILTASNDQSYVEISKPKPISEFQISNSKNVSVTKNVSKSNTETSETKPAELKENNKKVNKPNSSKSGDTWDWASIVSLCAGILGLFVAPILFGVIAVVFGAIGLSRTSKGKGRGKGFAIAGLVLGIIEVLIIFLVIGILVAAAA